MTWALRLVNCLPSVGQNLVLVNLTGLAGAGGLAGLAAQDGDLVVGRPLHLAYTVEHGVTWKSLGDALTYRTDQAWHVALTPLAITATRAEVSLTVVRLVASHRGPEGTVSFDSSRDDNSRDNRPPPELGYLSVLVGAPVEFSVSLVDGKILAVRGGDSIVARLDALVPSKEPGEPPPLQAAARAAYSDAALSRLMEAWFLRADPTSATTTMTLGSPLTGTAQRIWNGSTYRVQLANNGATIPVSLGQGSNTISGRLVNLSGEGNVTNRFNPAGAWGTWNYTLELTALSQPSTAQHRLHWTIRPVVLTP